MFIFCKVLSNYQNYFWIRIVDQLWGFLKNHLNDISWPYHISSMVFFLYKIIKSLDKIVLTYLIYFLNKWQKSNWMKTEMAIFCYVQKKIQSQNNFSQIFFKFNFLNAMQKVKINWIALHFLRSSYQKVVFCRWVPRFLYMEIFWK